MRKIAIILFILGSFLGNAQHTKKKAYKKPAKKTYLKKKAPTKTVSSTTITKEAIPAEGPKQVEEVKHQILQPVKEEPKAQAITEKPEYEKTAEKLMKKKGWIRNRNSAIVRGVSGFVKGVYSSNGKIFVMLEIANRSNINYDIMNIGFVTAFKKDKKKNIDFDTEEKIFLPIWSNQPETIPKKSNQKIVFVFDKFTINEEKILFAVVDENQGERKITLEIKPQYILEAEYIK